MVITFFLAYEFNGVNEVSFNDDIVYLVNNIFLMNRLRRIIKMDFDFNVKQKLLLRL